MERVAPTIDDARRAAEELRSAGVGTVLLFGSVARGDTDPYSDIDLVAIYGDLDDYGERRERRRDLEHRAQEASGCSVDVLVTDATEWAVRTQQVPCSLEAFIAQEAITLAETATHSPIDWDKQIDKPASVAAELEHLFTRLNTALSNLIDKLRPRRDEAAAAAAGDLTEHTSLETLRFAQACGAVHAVFEGAAKILLIDSTGAAPPREHRIVELLSTQPDWVHDAFAAAADGIDLVELSEWHEAWHQSERRPLHRYDDAYLRRHLAAAARIAAYTADRCSQYGFDADLMRRFEQGLNRCEAALDEALHVETERPASPQQPPPRTVGR